MKFKKINGKSNVIGKNIKKYRELRHLTQRELSDKISLLGIDIYHSDISQIENGKLMLKDLLSQAEEKLRKEKYTEETIKDYKYVWNKFYNMDRL